MLDLSSLSAEQIHRRNAIVEKLMAFYLRHHCCRRRPDWATKLVNMDLAALEKRHREVFKQEFSG